VATVRYFVDDVEAALAFYLGLGFKQVERHGPVIALLERGDLTLWVSGPDSSAARPMPDGVKPGSGGWNRFVIEVADLDKEIAALKARGVRFRNETVSGPGGRQVLILDPAGNVIELFEPRSAP
jgi:catechol 2,3-dioxygenase-like lactoylglutathione lyase family enzyme